MPQIVSNFLGHVQFDLLIRGLVFFKDFSNYSQKRKRSRPQLQRLGLGREISRLIRQISHTTMPNFRLLT